MNTQTYLVALGSNVRGRWGRPADLLETVVLPAKLVRLSRIRTTRPLGHGRRAYANAVASIESELFPPAFLAELKAVERSHGRRAGRRWGDRILDLDIVGWSGGRWSTSTLTIPHRAFRERSFVLEPLVDIASKWRDPVTRLTARQLLARSRKARGNYSPEN